MSQFKPATSAVLSQHLWPVATVALSLSLKLLKTVNTQWQIQGVAWFYLKAESSLEGLRTYEGEGQESLTFWMPPSLPCCPPRQFLEPTQQCSVLPFSRGNPDPPSVRCRV